jgi:hypothetical protein
LNGESSVADFFGCGIQSLLVPSGDCDLRTLPCKGFSNTQANPTVAARHHGNFALKSLSAHKSPPVHESNISQSILAKTASKTRIALGRIRTKRVIHITCDILT